MARSFFLPGQVSSTNLGRAGSGVGGWVRSGGGGVVAFVACTPARASAARGLNDVMASPLRSSRRSMVQLLLLLRIRSSSPFPALLCDLDFRPCTNDNTTPVTLMFPQPRPYPFESVPPPAAPAEPSHRA